MAKEAWATFSSLNAKQGAKSHVYQEGECSEVEHDFLKHAVLKTLFQCRKGGASAHVQS